MNIQEDREISETASALIKNLQHTDQAVRDSAVEKLGALDASEVLESVSYIYLNAESDECRQSALKVLAGFGAIHNLESIRADGWFERLRDKFTNFDTLCSIVGENFLAYSIIVGVQITALSVDRRHSANTTVEFISEGEDEPQVLLLGEYRRKVIAALEEKGSPEQPVQLPMESRAVQSFLGTHTILLAPIFNQKLSNLIITSTDPDNPRPLLEYFDGDEYVITHLGDYREDMRRRLWRELAGSAEEPLSLDLSFVAQAEAAAEKGNHNVVIDLLEGWPGLLSVLLRSPVAGRLTREQVDTIARGLELLGDAFHATGRGSWAEELYRLGLQFAREGPLAARLFIALANSFIEEKRYGEAIGALRRALALGHSHEEVYPLIGKLFMERGKYIAAAATLQYAVEEGWGGKETRQNLQEARMIIESAGTYWPF